MSTPTYKNLDSLIEQKGSGSITSDRNGRRITMIYRAKYSTCAAAVKTHGTLGSGSLTGYVLQESVVTHERGDIATLTDTWAAGGDDADDEITPLPADEVAVNPTNQNPELLTHPRYASLSGKQIALVETAMQGATEAMREGAYNALFADAQEVVDKMRAGNRTYYLAALRYSWATHYYGIPIITRGGYAESPSGPLASYFVSDIDWLREADDLQYSNGIWRLTRNWLGGADGKWDRDIYG